MTISLRLNEEESVLFKRYAEINGITISDLVRQAVWDRIEDEYDLEVYERAIAEHRRNPITYSHDEVVKMLELGE